MTNDEKKALLRLEAEELRFKIIINHTKQNKLAKAHPMRQKQWNLLFEMWPTASILWRLWRKPKKIANKVGMLSGLYTLWRLVRK